MWSPVGLFVWSRDDHTMHNPMVLDFLVVTLWWKNTVVLSYEKCRFLKPWHMQKYGPSTHIGGEPLAVFWCHKHNGKDNSLIWVIITILWGIATHFWNPFKDKWWICSRVIRSKHRGISKFYELLHLLLGEKEMIMPSKSPWSLDF